MLDFLEQLRAVHIIHLAILYTIIIIWIKLDEIQKRYSLPGPKPLPIIGNLFDLPKDHAWIHWAKHKDIYGPISSVTVFGQTLIILNDPKIAVELFEKRFDTYSDRPVLTFGGTL